MVQIHKKLRHTGQNTIYDVRHEKTDLPVFVVVIPKEELAGWGPGHPSLGMTQTKEFNI